MNLVGLAVQLFQPSGHLTDFAPGQVNAISVLSPLDGDVRISLSAGDGLQTHEISIPSGFAGARQVPNSEGWAPGSLSYELTSEADVGKVLALLFPAE